MDKNRAYIEIEKILYSIEYENTTVEEQKILIKEVLQKIQSYNYNLGKKQGIVKAIKLLSEFSEKMNKCKI